MSPHSKQRRSERSRSASRRTIMRQGGQGPAQGRGANAGEQKLDPGPDAARLVPEEADKGPRQTNKAEGDLDEEDDR